MLVNVLQLTYNAYVDTCSSTFSAGKRRDLKCHQQIASTRSLHMLPYTFIQADFHPHLLSVSPLSRIGRLQNQNSSLLHSCNFILIILSICRPSIVFSRRSFEIDSFPSQRVDLLFSYRTMTLSMSPGSDCFTDQFLHFTIDRGRWVAYILLLHTQVQNSNINCYRLTDNRYMLTRNSNE